ncbi:hypothetical protein [Propionivibrio sp.]|uniref:hypothetical protein n=1 Tax=Propionivibrio sp. TaxID=2212460 RepID=UPI003BF0C0E1
MNDRMTIDGDEMMLLDRYEAEFKETPPVAFLDPALSKKLLKEALRSKTPFGEKELDLL